MIKENDGHYRVNYNMINETLLSVQDISAFL